ncbi:MAG: hypothetical protein KGJ62_02515 [Armatimonadetes bacterium]|nr:hypothetical protein [Armatimonadota bacterium]MDE2205305.1 hypothetical protein [Armatimonadota bacterium]
MRTYRSICTALPVSATIGAAAAAVRQPNRAQTTSRPDKLSADGPRKACAWHVSDLKIKGKTASASVVVTSIAPTLAQAGCKDYRPGDARAMLVKSATGWRIRQIRAASTHMVVIGRKVS